MRERQPAPPSPRRAALTWQKDSSTHPILVRERRDGQTERQVHGQTDRRIDGQVCWQVRELDTQEGR